MTPEEIRDIEMHLKHGTAEVPLEEVLRMITEYHRLWECHQDLSRDRDQLRQAAEWIHTISGGGGPLPLEWGTPWRLRAERAESVITGARENTRRLTARLVANAAYLDKPFTDAPDQSPWIGIHDDLARLRRSLGLSAKTSAPADALVGEERQGG
ncbi:hypothetical protein [Herbidospora sp. RD11066]